MNFKLYKFSFLLLLGLAIVSCSRDDGDVSVVTKLADYEFQGLSERIEVSEIDTTLTIEFTFDDNQITDVLVDVLVDDSSTATEGEDFTLSTTGVDVRALQKSGSFGVTILQDYLTEGDESIFLTLESHGLAGPNSKTIEIVIKDIISTDLLLTFDWDGVVPLMGLDSLGIPDGEYPICGNVDLDVYVLDEMGADLGIYDAATGDCPETMIISGWADGTYVLASNMWENGYAGLGANVPFPITVSAFKQDLIDVTFVPDQVWTSEDLDQANDMNTDFYSVCTIIVSGDTYTVNAPDGSLIVSGFRAPHKTTSAQ